MNKVEQIRDIINENRASFTRMMFFRTIKTDSYEAHLFCTYCNLNLYTSLCKSATNLLGVVCVNVLKFIETNTGKLSNVLRCSVAVIYPEFMLLSSNVAKLHTVRLGSLVSTKYMTNLSNSFDKITRCIYRNKRVAGNLCRSRWSPYN